MKYLDMLVALMLIAILILIHSVFRNFHESLIKPIVNGDKSEWAGSAHNYHRMIYHSAKIIQLRNLKAQIVGSWKNKQ